MRKSLLRLFFIYFLFLFHNSNAQENRTLIAERSDINYHFEMDQNSPNPFDGVTDITFSSPVLGFVEFKIVNLIGKEIFRQVMEAEPGKNTIHVDGTDYMPGVYVYSLSNGSQTLTRRMVISKK